MTAILEQLAAASPTTLARVDRVLRGVPATFREWNERVTPTWRWDWPHMALLQETLEKVTSGEIDRLIIQMPPRHGKSETTSVRYPVYRLEDDPTLPVIVGAYNATLAAKFSRKARTVAAASGLPLSDERAAADDWETTKGGGVRAVGVGAGVTGHGGKLIIVDDPVKSREEAESPTYRDRVWDWFRDDLWTRREPGAAVIVIMTRWHEDDLVGRILESEDGPNWTVVSLPAIAEENDALGREPGAALCPDRYDESALAEIRTVLGAYSFAALFQQSPRAREGNMFPRDKATIVDAVPAGISWVRYWDKAGTEGGGANTAGVKMGIHQGVTYVADARTAQLGAERRQALMRQTAELDGNSCHIWSEQEPGSGGKESAENDIKLLAGFVVKVERVTGDKVIRAEPFAAQWQAGNVRLVRGAWNTAYLDEAEAFPNGKRKDQVDASSGAYNKLVLVPKPFIMRLS